MKFSIITVCYNSAKTIEKTLLSVANQDYKDIEYIIIDGKSSDETVSIINNKLNKVKLISEKDAGIYDAMNKGLDMCTGDVIAFLNADDFYAYPEVISEVACIFKLNNLDAVYGDAAFFSSVKAGRVIRRYRSNFFSPSRLSWGWMPAHPTLFLHRSVFDKYGKFSVNYKIAGDFEFIVRAFRGGHISSQYIPKVLVNMQAGGVSNSGLKSKILLNSEVMRACRENGLSTNLMKLLCKYPLKFVEYFLR